MINKKFGYALILFSFIFLWMHAFIIFNALYRWIFVLTVSDEMEVRRMISSSPLLDIGGPNAIVFILSTFAIGVLLLSFGIYILKKNRAKV